MAEAVLRPARIRARTSTSTAVLVPMNQNSTLISLAKLPTLSPTSIAPSPSPTTETIMVVGGTSPESLMVMSGFSPVFTFDVWPYTSFLGFTLMLWLGYLILPKGLRKQFFGAYPRRYRRSRGKQPAPGQWVYGSSSKQDIDSREESNLRQRVTGLHRQASPVNESFESSQILMGRSILSASAMNPPSSQGTSTSPVVRAIRGKDKYYTGAASDSSMGRNLQEVESSVVSSGFARAKAPPPSPHHPSIDRVPSSTILSETMKRLTGRGIRLTAHGVECAPKRVWIKLDDETFSLSWQTEFPRRIANQSGDVSIILMRGSVHKIALPNVLYIDVGKRTSALLRQDNRNVPATCCFSLLTQNGSLDLQTNSGLERDALVSCFSMILDQVHDRDWRLMYDDGSSVVSSSATTNQFPSDFVEV